MSTYTPYRGCSGRLPQRPARRLRTGAGAGRWRGQIAEGVHALVVTSWAARGSSPTPDFTRDPAHWNVATNRIPPTSR